MEIQVIRAEIGPETKKYWAQVKKADEDKAKEVVEEVVDLDAGMDFFTEDDLDAFLIYQKEKMEDEINDEKI